MRKPVSLMALLLALGVFALAPVTSPFEPFGAKPALAGDDGGGDDGGRGDDAAENDDAGESGKKSKTERKKKFKADRDEDGRFRAIARVGTRINSR